MNILILTWRDLKNPTSGGAETVTHELSKRWVKWGHGVTVFTECFPNGKRKEYIDGVTYLRYGSLFTLRFYVIYYYFKNFRKKFDLIIDQFHVFPFFTPLFVRKKIVAFIHETTGNIWWYQLVFPFSLLGWIIEPLVFKLYKNIPFITASNSTKNDLIKMGIHSDNIFVFRYGITVKWLEKIPEKEKYPTIISIGRLTPMKRIEDTIRAFYFVQNKFTDSKLWIIGSGNKSYVNKLKTLTKKLGISEKVIFWGRLPEDKKLDLLKKSWCLVSTSVKEGWGLVVTEASACGTSSIGYNVGGIRESIKHKETGILVNKQSPDALASEIKKLLSSPSKRQGYALKGLRLSQSFNWNISAKQVLEHLQYCVL